MAGICGVGVDAVDIGRFRQVLRRRPSLADRVFTAGELAYARGALDPAPRLAARFAAKEAALKVLGLGLGGVGWHELEVRRLPGGRPELAVRGRAAAVAAAQGVSRWHVSLTHTELVAVASLVAEGGERGERAHRADVPPPGAEPAEEDRCSRC